MGEVSEFDKDELEIHITTNDLFKDHDGLDDIGTKQYTIKEACHEKIEW